MSSKFTLAVFLVLSAACLTEDHARAEAAFAESRPFRILHIMSYHQGWEWNDSQLRGFEDALGGLEYELQVFEMDTKRNSSEEWKQERAAEAHALIEDWQPDLVYANDDNAQKYIVTSHVGGRIPFVFSGVNADPAEYGFVGSENVTGVLEREHSLQSVSLLRQLIPAVKRIAVIVDDGPTWPGVIREMRSQLAGLMIWRSSTGTSSKPFTNTRAW